MYLFIDGWRIAGTLIEKHAGMEYIPGSTTALHQAAKDIMQEIATKDGLPIEYRFSTQDASMIAWSNDPMKGRKIFDWHPDITKPIVQMTVLITPVARP